MISRRTLFILGGAIVVVGVLGIGAAIGGALAYIALKARPVQALAPLAQDIVRDDGILVAAVHVDSPAAAAGLTRGDILLEVDGQKVDTLQELAQWMDEHKPGDQVELSVLHGDEQRTLSATLGERDGRTYLGIETCGHPVEWGILTAPEFEPGIVIVEVIEGSPAAKSDLQAGDRIISIDGQVVDTETDLAAIIADHQPGDRLQLEVARPGGESRQLTITLGEHPDEPGKAYLGVKYGPFPRLFPSQPYGPGPFRRLPWDDSRFKLPEGIKGGVLIGNIKPDSPAENAGLRKGDLIAEIDGKPIQKPQDLVEIVRSHKPGDRLSLLVIRPGDEEPRKIDVTLGEDPNQSGQAYLGVSVRGFIRIDIPGEEGLPGDIPIPLPDDFFFQIPPLERLIPGETL